MILGGAKGRFADCKGSRQTSNLQHSDSCLVLNPASLCFWACWWFLGGDNVEIWGSWVGLILILCASGLVVLVCHAFTVFLIDAVFQQVFF